MNAPLAFSGIKVTDEQARIVEHLQHKPVTVVSAGAGAGKTYTTVAAVLELLASKTVQAEAFVLITFTNQSADDLRNRLQAELGKQVGNARDPSERSFWQSQRERLSAAFIGTIHGFCKQILNLYGYAQGVAREAAVSMSERLLNEIVEQKVESVLRSGSTDPVAQLILNETLAEYELRGLVKDMLREARSRGLRLDEVLRATQRQAPDDWQGLRVRVAALLCDIGQDFESAARDEQQLDAPALLLEADALLASTEGPRVVERLSERFRFLFIDEFQDTSETQARIASRLAGPMNVLVVGDGKQAIYAFAGASQSLLERFASQHSTKVLPLSQSGRPSKPLLAIQTVLFNSMSHRFPGFDHPLQPSARNLEPVDKLPATVLFLARADEDDTELQSLMGRRIKALIGQDMQRDAGKPFDPVVPGDVVVLVRTNDEASNWAEALQNTGVPARCESGTPLLRQPAVVSMYRFLQLLWRYPDDLALMEALPTPTLRGVDLADSQARILSYGKQRGQPLTGDFERLYPQQTKTLQDVRVASLTATVPQLLGLIERCYGLKQYYREIGDEGAALALDRLRDYARHCFDSDQALTLPVFLQMLRAGIMHALELREPSSGEEKPRVVRVMTIHRAKGLEFPVVVIPALEANRMPGGGRRYLLDQEQGLEINLYARGVDSVSPRYWDRLKRERELALNEEMRLFYVAATRAQRLLLMLGRLPTPPVEENVETRPAQLARDWSAVVEHAQNEAHPKEHSWLHEVARAWPAMQQQGALRTPLRNLPRSYADTADA